MANNSATSVDGGRARTAGVYVVNYNINTGITNPDVYAAVRYGRSTAAAITPTITTKKEKKQGQNEPLNYKWNLPPHAWSLPIRPGTMEPGMTDGTDTSSNFHNLRRGRLWFWAGMEDINAYASDGTVTTVGAIADAKNTGKKTDASAQSLASVETNYGFQFLWNPTTISSSVQRNMDITPSASDRLKAVSGAFPGQETVSFNIVLDRINDFAAFAGASKTGNFTEIIGRSGAYSTGYPGDNSETFNYKLKNLMEQGTMADLEYLFKAINGGNTGWKTLLGKKTANIGFLMPTLLGLVLGPDVTKSLSYVGWLTGITMQHEVFTQNMIPIRTTVSINMECFAGAGLVSS